MNRGFSPPVVTARGLVAAGVALLLISVYLRRIYKYVGLVDWPAGSSLALPGMGIVSIGVVYAVIGLGSLDVLGSQNRFRAALCLAFLTLPCLVSAYWVYGLTTGILGEFTPALSPVTSPAFLLTSAFAYLPIALGLPYGKTDELRHRVGLVLLAGILVSVPAYRLFQNATGHFALFAAVGWVVALAYDGTFAYPLYRFAERSSSD